MMDADLDNKEATARLRAELGNCLCRLKDRTPMALCLAPVFMRVPALSDDGSCAENSGTAEAVDDAAMRSAAQKLTQVVDGWGLRDCHKWAPLMDGKQVCCPPRDNFGLCSERSRCVRKYYRQLRMRTPSVGARTTMTHLTHMTHMTHNGVCASITNSVACHVQVKTLLGKSGPAVGQLLAAAKDWRFQRPKYHPAALQKCEPESLPPDALIEFLQGEIERTG